MTVVFLHLLFLISFSVFLHLITRRHPCLLSRCFLFVCFLVPLGFWHLLNRFSTNWAIPQGPFLFTLGYFPDKGLCCCPEPPLRPRSSYPCLLNSWVCRHSQPRPTFPPSFDSCPNISLLSVIADLDFWWIPFSMLWSFLLFHVCFFESRIRVEFELVAFSTSI
jgi:hypothetical protein